MPCLKPAMPRSPTVRLSLLGGLGVVLITAVVLSPVLQHDFVAWDDDVHVYANPHLQRVTWGDIGAFWQAPYAQLYIPLTYTGWAALAWLTQMLRPGPLTAELFHGLNLLLHLGSVAVVYRVGLLLGRRSDRAIEGCVVAGAALGALLFGLHPIQVEAVAWVSGLKDVLCGWWAVVAVWQYLAYAQAPSGRSRLVHFGLATGAFGLALLAKPVAVVVPIVAGCVAIVGLGQSWKGAMRALTGWLVVAGLWGILTKGQQPDVVMGYVTPWWGRMVVAADAVAFYLGKLVWPVGLGPDYGRTPQIVLGHWWGYVTGMVPLGIGLVLWWGKRRVSGLLLAAGIFLVGLLPVLGLVPFLFQGHSTVADRYVYLPLLGPALATGWTLQRGHRWKVGWLAGGLVIALLGWRSTDQVPVWHDTVTLFTHVLKVNPRSALAHNNLGLILAQQGRLDEAIVHYDQALQLKSDYAYTHNNLGLALANQGRLDEATAHYTEALRLKRGYTNARNNLALALIRQGRPDKAMAHFAKILQSTPDDATTHNNLGIALAAQGSLTAAMHQFALAVHLKPDYARAYHNLGLAFIRQGRPGEAQAAFRMALQLQPDWSPAALSLIQLLAKQAAPSVQAVKEAVALATQVCRVTGYRDATALYALAIAYQVAGQPRTAFRTAQQAQNVATAAGNVQLVAEIKSYFPAATLKEPIHAVY